MIGTRPDAPSAGGDAPPAVRVGFVVIGRNEAAHLPACFAALPASGRPLVYVDSESRDDSVAIAQRAGATVVRLDRTRPLTAARSRNAGAARLLELDPAVTAFQFVDGDCELVAGFVDAAARELSGDARLGGVCGRLLERRPEASPYNKMCALDWRMQRTGDGAYSGIMLVSVAAFRAVSGFTEELIAGEDPDFAFRLTQAGFTTRRIGHDIARHDAALASWAMVAADRPHRPLRRRARLAPPARPRPRPPAGGRLDPALGRRPAPRDRPRRGARLAGVARGARALPPAVASDLRAGRRGGGRRRRRAPLRHGVRRREVRAGARRAALRARARAPPAAAGTHRVGSAVSGRRRA